MPQKKSPAKAQAGKTELHYRLTNDEWLEAVHNLKPSERDLLYHLRTLDPFGDRTLDLTVTSLATTLKVNKSTVSRALKVLDGKGYIDLELLAVRVRLRTCGLEATALPSNNTVAIEQLVFPQSNQEDPVATEVVSVQQARSPSNICPPKTLLRAASKKPQTIHTDHTDQLSLNLARESDNSLFQENGEPIPEFRAWLVQTMNGLPERPRCPERWLEVNAGRTSMQRDFTNSQRTPEGTGVPPSEVRGQKVFKATEEDVLWQALRSCKAAASQGDQMRIWVELERLWRDGWQEVCIKICDQLPNCGVRVGENGLEQVQRKDEAG